MTNICNFWLKFWLMVSPWKDPIPRGVGLRYQKYRADYNSELYTAFVLCLV